MTDLPAIREPATLTQVDDQCAAVEAWAAEVEDVPTLVDASNRLSAIDEYLARTSKDGRARVAAAMRRLEVRIGLLLGPAQPGGPGRGSVDRVEHSLDRSHRHRFRRLAEHPDVVEQVIAESDDRHPPSQRKIMQAIETSRPRRRVSPSARDEYLIMLRAVKRFNEALTGLHAPLIGKAWADDRLVKDTRRQVDRAVARLTQFRDAVDKEMGR